MVIQLNPTRLLTNTRRYGDLKGTETLWECAQATGTDFESMHLRPSRLDRSTDSPTRDTSSCPTTNHRSKLPTTADDALARLSVINLVHEARGLDTSEGTMLVGLGCVCECVCM